MPEAIATDIEGGWRVVDKSVVVSGIKEGLEKRGITVKTSEVVRGHSGVAHSFDLSVSMNGHRIPIDVKLASEDSVELKEVLETYAKSLDARAKPAVVVAMPEASAEARRSAEAFGLVLVEGAALDQVLERLGPALEQALR